MKGTETAMSRTATIEKSGAAQTGSRHRSTHQRSDQSAKADRAWKDDMMGRS